MSDATPPINKLTQRDAELLASYSEGLLTEAEAREFNTRLHEAPELLTLIAHHAELEEHLRALLVEAHAADRGDWFLALAELEKGADQAELVDVETLMRGVGTTDSSDRPEPLTAHEALGALGYLAQQALRTRAGIISAAAAVVLLATAITLPLLVGEPSSNPSAQTTPPPRDQHRARPTPVATLTATHDAQWGGFEPSVADTLYAKQRLILTEGFAEITTARGAVAILEAPATIQLLDHNALHLETGKLVGICETDASKGFVVRTPHMDVTDLGTRFGVALNERDGTLAEVFEGRVRVSEPTDTENASAAGAELTGGQAYAIDATGSRISRDQFDSKLFASLNFLGDGVVGTVGQISRAPAAEYTDVATDDWSINEDVRLIPELPSYRLPVDIPVVVQNQGAFSIPYRNTPSDKVDHVTAGTVIRTYVLVVKTKGNGHSVHEGSITFSGEVLGLVLGDEQWQHFIDATSNVSADVIRGQSGMSHIERFESDKTSDMVSLSDDGRTLSFRLIAYNKQDVVRIIVRGPTTTAAGHDKPYTRGVLK